MFSMHFSLIIRRFINSNLWTASKQSSKLADLRLLSQKISAELQRNEAKSSQATISSLNAKAPSAIGLHANSTFYYGTHDAILYALGVGVSTKDKSGLKFLYEGHKNFSVLPTFAVVPVLKSLIGKAILSSLPDWNIDLSKLLLGEQYIELVRPLRVTSTVNCKVTIADVLDKGSGALLLFNGELADEQGELVAVLQTSSFIVGGGNFGGLRTSEKQIPSATPPSRNPDAIESFTTSFDQAALYRLSGDKNPLHICPNFAVKSGFHEPILQGLCSYGISARAVLKEFCNDDVTQFKSIMGRFAKPVIPGQTLETLMWKEGNRVHFETRVKETGNTCISGGYVDLGHVTDASETPSGGQHRKRVIFRAKQ